MEIQLGNLDSDEVKQLLQDHHEEMLKHSPLESVHALDITALKDPSVSFWIVRINGELAGCGALKKLSDQHAELKSMRTASKFLRKGVAAKLLSHMLEVAQKEAFEEVSLETGTMKAFIPAQTLYKQFGFTECQPFGDYQEDPFSMFFTKRIETFAKLD